MLLRRNGALPDIRRESPRSVPTSPSDAVESRIDDGSSGYPQPARERQECGNNPSQDRRNELNAPEPLPDANCAKTRHAGPIITSRGPGFRFVSPIQAAEPNGPSCSDTWPSRIRGVVPIAVRQWFHFSLLRQVLVETRSLAHRISLRRHGRTVLNYAEVSQSLPQVSCCHSRNAAQFCSAGIKELSKDRPYLTLGDLRLFAAGFLLAERWFAHRDTERRNAQQDSSANPDNGNSKLLPAAQQDSTRDLLALLPSQALRDELDSRARSCTKQNTESQPLSDSPTSSSAHSLSG